MKKITVEIIERTRGEMPEVIETQQFKDIETAEAFIEGFNSGRTYPVPETYKVAKMKE